MRGCEQLRLHVHKLHVHKLHVRTQLECGEAEENRREHGARETHRRARKGSKAVSTPSPQLCCVAALMSSAKAAAWQAARASWKLANKGDTQFAADRRLWKKQMTELRREWQLESLLARRAKYVEERETRMQAEAARAAEDKEGQREARLVERAAKVELEAEQRAKQLANNRAVSSRRSEVRREAEADFRRGWLQQMLDEYDLQPTEHSLASLRKRTWLTEEVRRPLPAPPRRAPAPLDASRPPAQTLEKRGPTIIGRVESPIDKWTGVAKKLRADEDQEVMAERLGGRLQRPPPTRAAPPAADDNVAPRGFAGALTAGTGAAGGTWQPPLTAPNGKPLPMGQEDEALMAQLKDLIADLATPTEPKEGGDALDSKAPDGGDDTKGDGGSGTAK